MLNTIFIVFTLLCSVFAAEPPTVNGGVICAGCTFGMGLADQLAQTYNESLAQALGQLCDYLPDGNYTQACKGIVDFFGPLIIDLWYMKETPDVICHCLGLCYTKPGHPECHLFPLPKEGLQSRVEQHQERADIYLKKARGRHGLKDLPSPCDLPGIKILCEIWDSFRNDFHPLEDLDGDLFSTVEAFRGTDWRGKDCNDLDAHHHPGARPINSDIASDSNCNGIYGVNEDGVPYEDLFCKDSGQLGIITLGDSAAAHFHVPVEWLVVKYLSKETLSHLPFVVENEFDWPMMSGLTGYKNITWPIISGPVHSAYQRMTEHNRCMHRDYQNIGVNGADSFDMQRNQKSLARNIETDHPVLLSYQLVGNDVCNHYADTLAHMTTPEQMWANVVRSLTYLETKLPNGSHVLLVGLADGQVLYDNLHKRFHPIGRLNHDNTRLPKGSHILLVGLADGRFMYNELHARLHPIGRLNGDVTYPDFYEFLVCLETCPCTGWMNTNETLRNLTSKRAKELSQVLSQVAKKYQDAFSNFDVHYVDCPLDPILEQWEKEHGPDTAYQLIEPVDGFHPNQMAQTLTAEYVWNYLQKNLPHYIGKANPYNQQILDIFGDQGGY